MIIDEDGEIKRAVLTEIPLDGEGMDKAFKAKSGGRYRVKIRATNRSVVRAVADKRDAAAPTAVTLTISLAELNSDNSVKKIEDKYLIHDYNEVTINHEDLANPGFDVNETLQIILEQMVAKAEAIKSKRTQLTKTLAEWGVSQ